MKKILYLGFNSFLTHKRGIENVIDSQFSILSGWGYYIHWGEELKAYKYKSFICISLPIHSVWKFLILSLIVSRIVKRNKKQLLIHSHNALMSVFMCQKTDLFTVHDGLYYQQKSLGVTWWKKCFFYLLETVLYKRCRKVHFISSFTKNQSLYPSKSSNYIQIYNTSNFELAVSHFTPDASLLYKEYPFLLGTQYCFIVRSLEDRARIDLVIATAEKRRDLFFAIAGKGPLFDVLQRKIEAQKIDNIRLLGFVTDENLFQLYTFASFVMVPAEYGEGFGLPIIEAYLFNKPVIASNCCAIPEVIIDKRYLFDNNIDSILKAIEFCKKCDHDDFLQYYHRLFSQKIIMEQYKLLYKECI